MHSRKTKVAGAALGTLVSAALLTACTSPTDAVTGTPKDNAPVTTGPSAGGDVPHLSNRVPDGGEAGRAGGNALGVP